MSTLEHSKACCEAVVAHAGPYTEKGTWTAIDGKKTYVTGPETAERGIIFIYDVFSFRPQTIQGADILAHASEKPCLVVMVDWFEGGAVQEEWLMSGEGRKLMYEFVETTASPTRVLPSILKTLANFKTLYPSVSRWGAVGYCWGGKLVSLIAAKGPESPLVAGAQSSPARLDPEEAKNVTIPMAMLASDKEDAGMVKEYGENLKADKHVEIFDTQTHGWMSARAELDNADVRSEYERGYQVLVDFFNKYL